MPDFATCISIVVPVFNAERELRSCVDSVREQTHRRWELTLIDDGSTDSSGAIADELAAADPRIRVIHTVNGGASRARNLGIAASTGAFIFFLDADDRLEPLALATLLAMQAKSGADLVIGSYNKVFDDRIVVPDDGGLFEDKVFDTESLDLYVKSFIRQPHVYTLLAHCWGRLFRADFLRAGILFDETLSQLEDVDINFRFLLKFPAVAYCATRIYNHTIRTGASFNMTSQMGSEDQASEKFLTAYGSVGEFLKQRLAADHAYELVGHLYVTTIILALIRTVRTAGLEDISGAYKKVKTISNAPDLRAKIDFYRPGPGDSITIHAALRMNMPILVIIFTLIRVKIIAHRRKKPSRRTGK